MIICTIGLLLTASFRSVDNYNIYFHKLITNLCFGTVFENMKIVASLSDDVKLKLTENISNKPGKRLIWGSKILRPSLLWRPFYLGIFVE